MLDGKTGHYSGWFLEKATTVDIPSERNEELIDVYLLSSESASQHLLSSADFSGPPGGDVSSSDIPTTFAFLAVHHFLFSVFLSLLSEDLEIRIWTKK